MTRDGGYAPSGADVGIITAINLTTGASSGTASLGTGIGKGSFAQAVTINASDDFEIGNTGTVLKPECDTFIYRIFRVGLLPLSNGTWPVQTLGTTTAIAPSSCSAVAPPCGLSGGSVVARSIVEGGHGFTCPSRPQPVKVMVPPRSTCPERHSLSGR
jgi:hypothetical protein